MKKFWAVALSYIKIAFQVYFYGSCRIERKTWLYYVLYESLVSPKPPHGLHLYLRPLIQSKLNTINYVDIAVCYTFAYYTFYNFPLISHNRHGTWFHARLSNSNSTNTGANATSIWLSRRVRVNRLLTNTWCSLSDATSGQKNLIIW